MFLLSLVVDRAGVRTCSDSRCVASTSCDVAPDGGLGGEYRDCCGDGSDDCCGSDERQWSASCQSVSGAERGVAEFGPGHGGGRGIGEVGADRRIEATDERLDHDGPDEDANHGGELG